jgi:excisionase family DNA binding protein
MIDLTAGTRLQPFSPGTDQYMTEKLAYSLTGAAAVSDISRESLYLYVRAGKLPARKIGRRYLILARDLKRFLSAPRPSIAPAPRRTK